MWRVADSGEKEKNPLVMAKVHKHQTGKFRHDVPDHFAGIMRLF